MQMDRQGWRSWMTPAGAPTALDWWWLALATAGGVTLAALLVTFFMIR
jgi:hypothetical protein